MIILDYLDGLITEVLINYRRKWDRLDQRRCDQSMSCSDLVPKIENVGDL